jgi:uncharacterized protein YggE
MAAPDRATVRVGVIAQAPTAQQAQTKASDIATKFIAAATALGVDKKDLQTSRVNLSPVYTNRPNEAPRITGYQATNTLSASVRDFNLIGRIIDAGIEAGANNVEGVTFELRDKGPMREALADAVRDAAAKGRVMAEALGMEIGGVFEVIEGGASPMPMYDARASFMEKAGTPIEPGQLEASANVTVRYWLKARR